MDTQIAYITCGSQEEAERIGRDLVESRLAACVNLIPGMVSMYHWQGKVAQDQEIILLAKTTTEQLSALTDRVKAMHSYDLPCIVAWPLGAGNADFLQWIKDEVGSPPINTP